MMTRSEVAEEREERLLGRRAVFLAAGSTRNRNRGKGLKSRGSLPPGQQHSAGEEQTGGRARFREARQTNTAAAALEIRNAFVPEGGGLVGRAAAAVP